MKTLFLFLTLLFTFASCDELLKEDNNHHSNNNNSNPNKKGDNPNKNNDRPNPNNQADVNFTYKGNPLILTKHAQCRMDCRHIDKQEIMDVIAQNNINARKSDPKAQNGPSPTFAYEGNTKDGQNVRIVIAEYPDKGKVVTVIDLKNDFECSCE